MQTMPPKCPTWKFPISQKNLHTIAVFIVRLDKITSEKNTITNTMGSIFMFVHCKQQEQRNILFFSFSIFRKKRNVEYINGLLLKNQVIYGNKRFVFKNFMSKTTYVRCKLKRTNLSLNWPFAFFGTCQYCAIPGIPTCKTRKKFCDKIKLCEFLTNNEQNKLNSHLYVFKCSWSTNNFSLIFLCIYSRGGESTARRPNVVRVNF